MDVPDIKYGETVDHQDIESPNPSYGDEKDVEEVQNITASVMDLAEIIFAVDQGSFVTRAKGLAGEVPEQDDFVEAAAKKWIFFLWSKSPQEWTVLESDIFLTEDDFCSGDVVVMGENLPISAISEVFLELEPSASFRVYMGDSRDVVRFTPVPESRETAAAWVDAIFSAMKLQSIEAGVDLTHIKEVWLDEAQRREEEAEQEYLAQNQLVVASNFTETDTRDLVPAKDKESVAAVKRRSVQIDFINIYGPSSNNNSAAAADETTTNTSCCCMA